MRITEHLLVQCPSSSFIVIMDESTGAEILIPAEAVESLMQGIDYFRRVTLRLQPKEEDVRLPDEPEQTRILINPNLRVDGPYTIVDYDDVFGPRPKVGQEVEVFTAEPMNWVGTGRVSTIDRQDRTIKVAVDWESLRNK